MNKIPDELVAYFAKDGVTEAFFRGWEDCYFEVVEPENDDSLAEAPVEVCGYTFNIVQHHGGEGEGDVYYNVYQFDRVVSGDRFYVKFNGWYESYSGSTFTDYSLVTPVEKTITVYEAVK